MGTSMPSWRAEQSGASTTRSRLGDQHRSVHRRSVRIVAQYWPITVFPHRTSPSRRPYWCRSPRAHRDRLHDRLMGSRGVFRRQPAGQLRCSSVVSGCCNVLVLVASGGEADGLMRELMIWSPLQARLPRSSGQFSSRSFGPGSISGSRNERVPFPSGGRASLAGALDHRGSVPAAVGAFFRTRVLQYDEVSAAGQNNRLRAIPLQPARGAILDRDGKIIAETVPGYSVALLASSTDSLRQVLKRSQAGGVVR